MPEDKIYFQKYRTSGNAYLVFDNRNGKYDNVLNNVFLKKCLDEDIFGLSASGIVELKKDETETFNYIYHEGNGEEGRACGTGSMCGVRYAKDNLIVPSNCKQFSFRSYIGLRSAHIEGDNVKVSTIPKFEVIEYDSDNYLGDSGCFIHVEFVNSDFEKVSVVELGKKEIFNGDRNANSPQLSVFILAQILGDNELQLRAYCPASSMDKEFFNCGTGSIVAAAASMIKLEKFGMADITVKWRYGNMIVRIQRNKEAKNTFTNTYLEGAVHHVADCSINLSDYVKSTKYIQF